MSDPNDAGHVYTDEEIEALAEAYGATLVAINNREALLHFKTFTDYVDALKWLWDAAEKRAEQAEAERDAARAALETANRTIHAKEAVLDIYRAIAGTRVTEDEPTGGRESEAKEQ